MFGKNGLILNTIFGSVHIYLQSSGDDPLDKLLCCQGIFRVDNNKNPPLFRLFVGVATVDIISNRRSPVTNNVDLIQNQSAKFG